MASLRISFYTIVKVRTWQIQKRVIVLHFNPYHREGGDELKEMLVDEYVNFNPHHREGGDPGAETPVTSATDFNPHHREGGDK